MKFALTIVSNQGRVQDKIEIGIEQSARILAAMVPQSLVFISFIFLLSTYQSV